MARLTWTRPDGRAPWRQRLSEERQKQLVADYLAGVSKARLVETYEVSPPQLYIILRVHNVKPQRKKRKKDTAIYCVVCGEAREKPKYNAAACWHAIPTCGHPACKSIMLLRPELRRRPNPSPLTGPERRKPPPRWEDPEELAKLRALTALTEAELIGLEKHYSLRRDERFADEPEGARKALWRRGPALAIAIRLNALVAGESTLHFYGRQPRKKFLQEFFGGAESTARSYDVLLSWRCGCPEQATYALFSLDDFPSAEGSYGVCPRCGAAALEIEYQRPPRVERMDEEEDDEEVA